jgi:hypothetical protein
LPGMANLAFKLPNSYFEITQSSNPSPTHFLRPGLPLIHHDNA